MTCSKNFTGRMKITTKKQQQKLKRLAVGNNENYMIILESGCAFCISIGFRILYISMVLKPD